MVLGANREKRGRVAGVSMAAGTSQPRRGPASQCDMSPIRAVSVNLFFARILYRVSSRVLQHSIGTGISSVFIHLFIDPARIPCGRVCVTVQCPSVCLSLLSMLLLRAWRAGDIDQQRRPPSAQQHGVQQQMRAVSRCQLT